MPIRAVAPVGVKQDTFFNLTVVPLDEVIALVVDDAE
jgi:hypothetical protein